MSDTFKVDNVLIQNAPKTFGAKLQPYLPGLAPYGNFDFWMTLACYSLLDPENPEGEVFTTYTNFAETLRFTREVSNALAGYETFPSDAYDMIEASLHRLYSLEVNWETEWAVRLTDGSGRPTRGRPKKQRVTYKGRILTSYGYTYPKSVTPPELQPAAKRENVNKTKGRNGEAPPPIYRNVEGPRPLGVHFRLAPELVKGITKTDPHIGATTIPLRIFALRKTFGKNPTATRLLVWVCRQTSRSLTRRLDGLADEMSLDKRRLTYNRTTLVNGFEMLKSAGVIEDFVVAGADADDPTVAFTKAAGWHFAAGEKDPKPALPGPKKKG